MRTASGNGSAGLSGQTPPNRSGGLREVFEDLAGDITFQTADDLGGGAAFRSTPGHINAGLFVTAHAGKHDPVEGSVGVAVTTPVEPIPGGFA